jgi:hypothetical protein
VSSRQLILLIGVTTVLALGLAWLLEKQSARAFANEMEARWKLNAEEPGTSTGAD